MNKLIFLVVVVLAAIASVNAQVVSAPVTVSQSLSQTMSQSMPMTPSSSNSLSSSVSTSFSITATASVSSSFSNSQSGSVSSSFSNSQSTSNSVTNSPSPSSTKSESPTPSGTGSDSNTVSMTMTSSNSMTMTMSGTMSISISMSMSGNPLPSPTMTPAPPPTNLVQVTAGCGSGRKIICVSWARPAGVPASNYYVVLTGVVSGAKQAMNFSNGETFAMFTGLNPATAYTVTVQTLFMGTLSSAATMNIMTAAPAPKQMPSLGITGFSCRAAPSPTQKKKRNIICNWTNGATPYTRLNLRIKCTGKAGTAFDGKHKNVRRMLKAGASSHTEGGFFQNARCKIIANPGYASGPGRRIVQIIEIN